MSTNHPRRAKLALPAGHLGNLHGGQRPVQVPKEMSRVRAVVAGWYGRTLRVQSTEELKRVLAILEEYDGRLADLSAHAPRLLAGIRAELAKPERT